MNLHTKKELETQAQEVFNQYPDETKCFAREDGNIFFSENHANLDKGKLKIYEIEKFSETPKVVAPKVIVPKAVTPEVDKTLGLDGKNPELRDATNTSK